jgi:hypothetical protein
MQAARTRHVPLVKHTESGRCSSMLDGQDWSMATCEAGIGQLAENDQETYRHVFPRMAYNLENLRRKDKGWGLLYSLKVMGVLWPIARSAVRVVVKHLTASRKSAQVKITNRQFWLCQFERPRPTSYKSNGAL